MSKINSLVALQLEKERLKLLCKDKEDSIGHKLDYIQDNIGAIALEGIFNSEKKEFLFIPDGVLDIVGKVIDIFKPEWTEKINKYSSIIRTVELIASLVYTQFFNQKKETN